MSRRGAESGASAGADGAVADRLAALEGRVRRLEDELAIHRLIVRYGFAVDAGDAESTGALFAADTVYDIDADRVLEGRDGVRAMVRGPSHRALLPNCAHTIGPAVVEVSGDRATATAYSRIYLRGALIESRDHLGRARAGASSEASPSGADARSHGDPADERIHLWRLSLNRFELERRDGRWEIARRTTRLLGHAEATSILERALAPGTSR